MSQQPSKLALALSIGSVITSNIIGGIFFGYLLDRWLKTEPWLLMTGVILGTTFAFVLMYRILSRASHSD